MGCFWLVVFIAENLILSHNRETLINKYLGNQIIIYYIVLCHLLQPFPSHMDFSNTAGQDPKFVKYIKLRHFFFWEQECLYFSQCVPPLQTPSR
eukprot:UN00485